MIEFKGKVGKFNKIRLAILAFNIIATMALIFFALYEAMS